MFSSQSAALTIGGEGARVFLWSWGNLTHKIPARHKQRTPKLVESLETEQIKSVACDARHIVIVTSLFFFLSCTPLFSFSLNLS